MVIRCFDPFKKQFLFSFWLDKSIHLTHFSQYSNFLTSENLRKSYPLAQNGKLAQNGFMYYYYYTIYYIRLYYNILLITIIYTYTIILFEDIVFQGNILLLLSQKGRVCNKTCGGWFFIENHKLGDVINWNGW